MISTLTDNYWPVTLVFISSYWNFYSQTIFYLKFKIQNSNAALTLLRRRKYFLYASNLSTVSFTTAAKPNKLSTRLGTFLTNFRIYHKLVRLESIVNFIRTSSSISVKSRKILLRELLTKY